MDLNPKTGKRLTDTEVADIAIKHGVATPQHIEKINAAFHNPNMIRSYLDQMTMDVRHKMWGRGELKLSTGDPGRPQATGEPEIMKPWVEKWRSGLGGVFHDRRGERA